MRFDLPHDRGAVQRSCGVGPARQMPPEHVVIRSVHPLEPTQLRDRLGVVVDADVDVDRALLAQLLERPGDEHPILDRREVGVHRPAVDGDRARPVAEPDAGDRGLAAPGGDHVVGTALLCGLGGHRLIPGADA